MNTSLGGRTALVTGAGRGIGRAAAVGLAQAGVTVALVARSDEQLAETALQVRSVGGSAVVIRADLQDQAQRLLVVDAALNELGPIDILINNAAVVWPLGPSVAVDFAEWTASVTINLVAVAHLAFALIPSMQERRWGRVVNVSSSVVARPQSMVAANAYVTTKAALEAHTVNLAAELADSGVTVNAFRPGSVDTAMQAWIRDQDPLRIGPALHRHFVRSHTEGALITAEQTVRSMLRRLSEDETGQIWDVSDPVPPHASGG